MDTAHEESEASVAAGSEPAQPVWEYLMLEVIPWLDGWEYRPLDDKGIPMEHRDEMALGVWTWDMFNPPGLNGFGAKGWEVAGVVPEMRLYDRDGEPFHDTKQTVLLLKRRKA